RNGSPWLIRCRRRSDLSTSTLSMRGDCGNSPALAWASEAQHRNRAASSHGIETSSSDRSRGPPAGSGQDGLPPWKRRAFYGPLRCSGKPLPTKEQTEGDRKSTRLNSSHVKI